MTWATLYPHGSRNFNPTNPATIKKRRASFEDSPLAEHLFTRELDSLRRGRLSADVLPVPRLVVVRPEAELVGVADEPAVGRRLNLYGAVRVLRLDGFAADVEVERAAREVRAVDGESGASGVGRLAAEVRLVLRRAEGRDDLEELFVGREFARRRVLEVKRRVGAGRRDHPLVGRVSLALALPQLVGPRSVVEVRDGRDEHLAGLRGRLVFQTHALPRRDHLVERRVVEHAAGRKPRRFQI